MTEKNIDKDLQNFIVSTSNENGQEQQQQQESFSQTGNFGSENLVGTLLSNNAIDQPSTSAYGSINANNLNETMDRSIQMADINTTPTRDYFIRSSEEVRNLIMQLHQQESHLNRSIIVDPIDHVIDEKFSSPISPSSGSNSACIPPLHDRNYQAARYKTELCLHFRERNQCPHGLQCLFAHGLNELRSYRGRHPKHKTQRCKAFHENGYCDYGYRCSYIHSESPRTIRYMKNLNRRAQNYRRLRLHIRRHGQICKKFKWNKNPKSNEFEQIAWFEEHELPMWHHETIFRFLPDVQQEDPLPNVSQ